MFSQRLISEKSNQKLKFKAAYLFLLLNQRDCTNNQKKERFFKYIIWSKKKSFKSNKVPNFLPINIKLKTFKKNFILISSYYTLNKFYYNFNLSALIIKNIRYAQLLPVIFKLIKLINFQICQFWALSFFSISTFSTKNLSQIKAKLFFKEARASDFTLILNSKFI